MPDQANPLRRLMMANADGQSVRAGFQPRVVLAAGAGRDEAHHDDRSD